MRMYKAFLDNDFNVVSYEEPSEIETIFSYKNQETFDVDLSILQEYLELNGYVTTYKMKGSDEDFVMYIDMDYNFHTIWDNETSIFVMNQIKQKQMEQIWEEIEKNQGLKHDNFKGYIHTYPSIQGMSEFKVGEEIHLRHTIPNGIWQSSNDEIASIDRHTALIKAKKKGKAIISYIVDTGFGMASVFHQIRIM